MKKYYFINAGENPDRIYGDGYPVCIDQAEFDRLSREWDLDLHEIMHEASPEEIAEYGVYDA